MVEIRKTPYEEVKKVDQFTFEERSRRLSADSIVASFGEQFVNATLALGHLIRPEQTAGLSFAIFCNVIGVGGLNILNSKKAREMRVENTKKDADLEVKTEYFLYNGKVPLESNGLTINAGDGVVAVSIPELTIPDTQQSLPLVEDYYDVALRTARDQIKDKPYKFVAINKPHSEPGDNPSSRAKEATSLVVDKQVVLEEETKEVFLLTRKEFEDLSISPQEGFAKIKDGLNNPQINSALALLSSAETAEQRLLVKENLARILRRLIQRELDIRTSPQPLLNRDSFVFNQRDPTVDPTSDEITDGDTPSLQPAAAQVPFRTKVFPSTKVVETSQGGLFIQSAIPGVGVQRTPIERVLKTKDLSVAEAIDSTSEYRTAQLEYMMYGLVKDTDDMNDLIRTRITDPKVLKDELARQSISLTSQDILKVDKGKSFSKEFKRVHRRGRIVLATALLWAGSQAGIALMRHPDALSDALHGTQDNTTETLHQPSFPDGLPARHLDWEITEKGLDTGEYFITETANDYKDGKWVVTTERADEVKFETSVPDDQKQLILKRTQPSSTTKFKLPVQPGRHVAALNITDNRNIPVPYHAYILIDGTVEINLEGNRALLSPSIIISETLTDSLDPKTTPHAIASHIQIDESKLTPNAQQLVNNIRDLETKYPAAIAAGSVIEEGRNYSLDPANKQAMNPHNINSPTDYINGFATLDGASCDIANSAEVILANQLNKPNGANVNLAIGYLNGTGSPASPSQTKFLRSDLSHAFGIYQDGEIIDATPRTLANDPLTQAYAKQLEGSPDGVSDEELWKQQQEEIINKGSLQQQLVLLTELLGGSAAGFFALRQSSRLLKRLLQRDSIADIPDKAVLTLFSDPKELEKAYNFYSWISFGNQKDPSLDQAVSLPESSKSAEVIDKFQQNMNIERLGMYSEHPGKYEKLAKLTPKERIKMRLFANYLLS